MTHIFRDLIRKYPEHMCEQGWVTRLATVRVTHNTIDFQWKQLAVTMGGLIAELRGFEFIVQEGFEDVEILYR